MNAWTTALTASAESDRTTELSRRKLIVTGATNCRVMIGHDESAVQDDAEVADSVRHGNAVTRGDGTTEMSSCPTVDWIRADHVTSWINSDGPYIACCVLTFASARLSSITYSLFTARCTLVQSAVLRSHVVCLSVRL